MLNNSLKPSSDIIELLEETEIGTPGKSITYKLSDVKGKITHISSPIFIRLEKKSGIIGTCCFCKRKNRLTDQNVHSFYIRYFTFASAYRKMNGINKKTIDNSGILKEEVRSLLNGKGIDDLCDKHFFYAYVDPDNSRSLALCNFFGFNPVRNFSTIVYSRHKPKMSVSVSRYKSVEKEIIESNLKSFYKNYTMFSLENVFYKDNYYVLRANGKIIAGVQANQVNWKITNFPGFFGRLLLRVLPYLPVVQRYFSMDFKFISFEAIFYKKSYEKELEKLFDAVLAIHNAHTALLWVDNNSELFKIICKIKKGLFGTFFKSKPAKVIVKGNGLSENEQAYLEKLPAYISAFDLT